MGSTRSLIVCLNQLSETLESVQDTDTARAAIPQIEAAFARIDELAGRQMAIVSNKAPSEAEMQEFFRLGGELQKVEQRLNMANERLERLEDLPSEFWAVWRMGVARLAAKGSGSRLLGGGGRGSERGEVDRAVIRMLETHPPEEVISIELRNLPEEYSQAAFDRLRNAARGAELVHSECDHNRYEVALGPVRDFRRLAAGVNFGTVVLKNASAGILKIEVDRRKLGARANSDAEEQRLERQAEERRRANERRREEARRKAEQAAQEAQRRREREGREAEDRARERERRGPEPGDPIYHDEMADRMLSEDWSIRNKAISVLSAARPEDVKSPATRKKIAQAFRTLAKNESGPDREKAIRGLVRWGGTYSTPILLEMFKDSSFTDRKPLYEAFGELKDPSVIPTIANQLTDRLEQADAERCLVKIGPAAEDAILVLAPSPDPELCLAAIRVLGQVGTEKSLPILRRAVSNGTPKVKETAKTAIRMIRFRASQGGSS
ncbi:MAG: HEAT repeat domain-containing protein [Pirellulales bacterium]|nr:HEAT repeat domain-containing protein [Pirellulales bacterium]